MVMRKSCFLALALALCAIPLSAQLFDFDGSGPARPTISATAKPAEGRVLFVFSLRAGNHITDLKNGFFKIALAKNEWAEIDSIDFPRGTPYDGEEVFKGTFTVPVHLKTLQPIASARPLAFHVSFQICREFPEEVCFAPDAKDVTVTLEPGFVGVNESSQAGTNSSLLSRLTARLKSLLQKQKGSAVFLTLIMLFALGFITSLTPCVYPIIPIVMGYVGSRAQNRRWKGFVLSLCFALGLALVYSILGVVAALTGSLVGVTLQSPWMVALIAAVFFIMGLSMAGVFTITAPAFVSAKLGKSYRSQILGALAIGGISGLIAAPCVGPVLIAILAFISQTRNAWLGFIYTFSFSLGISVIFIVLGTFSGAVAYMPKGGKWMEGIKKFFALLLLGAGIYLWSTILHPGHAWLLWGVFLLATAVFGGLFQALRPDAGMSAKAYKTLVALVFLIGAIFFVKGFERSFFTAETVPPASSPRAAVVSEPSLKWLSDFDEGRRQAKERNLPLLVDVYADWCLPCKKLERETFSDPQVMVALGKFVLVRLDVTRPDERSERIQKELGIFGPPTMIFFSPAGKETGRIAGFYEPADFLLLLPK